MVENLCMCSLGCCELKISVQLINIFPIYPIHINSVSIFPCGIICDVFALLDVSLNLILE